jgi:Ca-activated chloride channel family protein
LQISTTEALEKVPKSYKYYFLHVPFALRMLAFAFLIIVLARPQSTDNWSNQNIEGIDIMMVIDVSGSMLAEDLRPNRIEAAKTVGTEFISARTNDNIGLVVFAGESFTQCPLTTDKAALINLLNAVHSDMMESSNTAIGMGLANAVNRLKESSAKSKVVILLTDGSNNTGEIDPLTAAELAKTFGIRVYTIGVGTRGSAPYPVQTPFGTRRQMIEVDIDEGTLRKISGMTDGKYFRATDNKSLKAVYEEIDKLEKTKIQVREYSKKQEEYLPFAIAALILLILEILLRNTILRHNP